MSYDALTAEGLEGQARIKEVLDLFRAGRSSAAIQAELAPKWEVTERQVRRYIREAAKFIGECMREDSPYIAETAIQQYDYVAECCLRGFNFRDGLRAMELRDKIRGLFVERVQHEIPQASVNPFAVRAEIEAAAKKKGE